MSLVTRPLLIVGTAAMFAVLTPILLVQSPTPELAQAAAVTVTPLDITTVPALAAALATPAFNQNRSPLPPIQPSISTDDTSVEATSQSPPPRLVGLIVNRRSNGLAIVRSASGETLNLRPGADVDGWRLVRVSADRAIFARNGASETVRLDFTNRDDATPRIGATPAIAEAVPPSPSP